MGNLAAEDTGVLDRRFLPDHAEGTPFDQRADNSHRPTVGDSKYPATGTVHEHTIQEVRETPRDLQCALAAGRATLEPAICGGPVALRRRQTFERAVCVLT